MCNCRRRMRVVKENWRMMRMAAATTDTFLSDKKGKPECVSAGHALSGNDMRPAFCRLLFSMELVGARSAPAFYQLFSPILFSCPLARERVIVVDQ